MTHLKMKHYDLDRNNGKYAVKDRRTGKLLSDYLTDKEMRLHLGKHYKSIYAYMANKLSF